MKGLWRVDHALAEVIQLQDQGDHTHAQAYVCQLRKALHQVALDHGDWTIASKLLPTKDPLDRPAFGGTEKELQAIHAYQKSIRELKTKHTHNLHPHRSEQESPGAIEGGGKGGAKNKRAGKDGRGRGNGGRGRGGKQGGKGLQKGVDFTVLANAGD